MSLEQAHATVVHQDRTLRAKRAVVGLATCVLVLAATAAPAVAAGRSATDEREKPVRLSVLSPHRGDRAGQDGAGFVVDLALIARNDRANTLLSTEAGYKPLFNNPTAPTFHTGANEAAPGLVVMLSTTPNLPGTQFQGPRTNLAGLFQLNGVTTQRGLTEIRNAWHVGRAGFGAGRAMLTAYAIVGKAPTVVAETPAAGGMLLISNIVKVPFRIDEPPTSQPSSGPTR
jgi:hypothetical protein